ncbi:MAG: putative membrane protein [Hyphomicrobiaceae bacterium]|jgi:putative membrane protein
MSKQPPRKPQVFDADDPQVMPSDPAPDRADEASGTRHTADTAAPEAATSAQSPAEEMQPSVAAPPERPGRFGFFGAFISAVLALSSLAIGLWFSRFVSIAVARDDWIGWGAKGLAVFIAGVIVIVLVRELIGYFRLARLGRLRRDAEQAISSGDVKTEKRVVQRLKSLASGRAEYKWALATFREQERHQTQPGALLGLADQVLLADADKESRRIIYESARRVAVVTAVVPIAFIAMLFVLFENIRMVRRLAGAYGGRPGMIAGSRLLLRVIFHIAATGAIALTDDLFGQFLGQDMMRRLSARLGEGAFNGALTARLGIVAIELCRPCPYIKAKPLRARHVVSELFPEFSAGELIGRAVGRKPKEAAPET